MSNTADQLLAILFVAHEPVAIGRLMDALGTDRATVEQGLNELNEYLTGGIIIIKHDDQYQLVTSPNTSHVVAKFLQQETKTDLSRAALETLAIIAYRGPISKSGIEEIRGVASDTMLKNLMLRGLISESTKDRESRHVIRYVVSHSFLQQFGLSSIEQLPALPTDGTS